MSAGTLYLYLVRKIKELLECVPLTFAVRGFFMSKCRVLVFDHKRMGEESVSYIKFGKLQCNICSNQRKKQETQ